MKNLAFKQLLLSFAVVVASLTTAFTAAKKKLIEVDYNTKGITINNRIARLSQDQKPFTTNDIMFTVDGKMYVPLTFFAEALGYKIENNYYIQINGKRLNHSVYQTA